MNVHIHTYTDATGVQRYANEPADCDHCTSLETQLAEARTAYADSMDAQWRAGVTLDQAEAVAAPLRAEVRRLLLARAMTRDQDDLYLRQAELLAEIARLSDILTQHIAQGDRYLGPDHYRDIDNRLTTSIAGLQSVLETTNAALGTTEPARCPQHDQPATSSGSYQGYAGGACTWTTYACGCTDNDDDPDVEAAR